MKQKKAKFWAVIPAAGVGKRMGSDVPKQYLKLGNSTVIERTLTVLLDHYGIDGAVVALGKDDPYWPGLEFTHHKPLYTVDGGKERYDSVLNALKKLLEVGDENDWVLVHDAARPNLSSADIAKLIEDGSKSDDGALLGYHVRDTMKRAGNDNRVEITVDRVKLWHALTPQMFPLRKLYDATVNARQSGVAITDDASAMELAGYTPLMVAGDASNIKITTQNDYEIIQKIMGLCK